MHFVELTKDNDEPPPIQLSLCLCQHFTTKFHGVINFSSPIPGKVQGAFQFPYVGITEYPNLRISTSYNPALEIYNFSLYICDHNTAYRNNSAQDLFVETVQVNEGINTHGRVKVEGTVFQTSGVSGSATSSLR